MPIDYRQYPANWKSEIRPAILARAKNCCEICGLHNGAIGYRRDNGLFVQCDGHDGDAAMLDGYRVFRVVLTISHLNHDIADIRPENLRALCQRCHLLHDVDHHRGSRFRRKSETTPELPGIMED